jgi:hypothetical protein
MPELIRETVRPNSISRSSRETRWRTLRLKLTAEWRIKDDGHLIRLALDPLKTNASPKA